MTPTDPMPDAAHDRSAAITEPDQATASTEPTTTEPTTTEPTDAEPATTEPTTTDPFDNEGGDSDSGEPARGPGRSRPMRFAAPALVFALAVALAVTGVVLLGRACDLDDRAPSANRAVIDREATATVIGQVSTGLNGVLSYDYRKPATAQAAAKRWLTGDAPAQYRLLFQQLNQLAPGQKLTLVAKVSTAGVTSLKDGRAALLVFLDQQSTRASDGQRSVSAAQVQITAVQRGNRWLISELRPI